MKKGHAKTVIAAFSLSLLFTLLLCCATTKKPRKIDAPRPSSEYATLDLSRFYSEGLSEVVKSRDFIKKKSVLVVMSEASRITDADYYSRLIRKILLNEGIKVVTGEVRARIEEYKEGDLQNRKETLQEAEKLILLGGETGAEGILVFDQINAVAEIQRDVHIVEGENQFTLVVKQITTEKPSEDPNVLRVTFPAVVVRGRLVDTETANITAEFDICQFYYKNIGMLKSYHDEIVVSAYDANTQTGTIMVGSSCCGGGKQYESYKYVDSWIPRDVRRQSILNEINKFIPTIQEIDTIETDTKLREILTNVVEQVL